MTQSPIPFVVPASVTVGLGAPPTLLSVPYLSQTVTNWCWATCVTMLVRFWGGTITICQAASKLIPNDGCCTEAPEEGSFDRFWKKGTCNRTCTVDEVGELHRRLGLVSNRSAGQISFDALAEEVAANGRPIEVAYAWTGGGGHVAIVRGIDADTQTVYICDPWPDYGQTVAQFNELRTAYGKGTWFETWTGIGKAEV